MFLALLCENGGRGHRTGGGILTPS
jgi:hypothetical protein